MSISVINENTDIQPGNIYRCYYSENLNSWVSKELRDDKKNPNNNEICHYITQCHLNKWNIEDIINLYSSKPYYVIDRIDTSNTMNSKIMNSINSKKLYKYDINKIIKLISHKSVLDIACGYKAKTLQEKIPGKYVGLDSDIHVANIQNAYTFDMCYLWSKQKQSFGPKSA